MKVCSEPGCPELVPTGTGYCPKHTREQRRVSDAKRAAHRSHYNGSRWRKVRRAYLLAHPLCERCGVVATVVHHIDGLGLHGPLAYSFSNLEALCKRCHDIHTAKEQPGGWNQ